MTRIDPVIASTTPSTASLDDQCNNATVAALAKAMASLDTDHPLDEAAAAAAAGNMGVFLRFEVKSALTSYQSFLRAAALYRTTLAQMSSATLQFANALNDLSKCRGAAQNSEGFKCAAGLFESAATQQQQLSDQMLRDFEMPLTKNLETHQARVWQAEKQNTEQIRQLTEAIRQLERKCVKSAKKPQKQHEYSQALQELTEKGNELERVKHAYYARAIDAETRHFQFLLQKCTVAVKAETNTRQHVANLFASRLDSLVQSAYSPDGSALPAALVAQYCGSDNKGTQQSISVVAVPNITTQPLMRSASTASRITAPRSGSGASQVLLAKSTSRVEESSNNETETNNDDTKTSPTVQESSIAEETSISTSPTVTPAINAAPAIPTTEKPIRTQTREAQQMLAAAAVVAAKQQALDLIETDQVELTSEKVNVPVLAASPAARAAAAAVSAGVTPLQLDSIHKRTSSIAPVISPTQPVSSATPTSPISPDYVLVLHSFKSREARELSVEKGQILLVKRTEASWLYAVRDDTGAAGWVPRNYTRPHPSPSATCQ